MVRPRSDAPKHSKHYGLGFWLHASNDGVLLEGYDAGVSFRSVHDPRARVTLTVISNTSDGAWPIARYLELCRLEHLVEASVCTKGTYSHLGRHREVDHEENAASS